MGRTIRWVAFAVLAAVFAAALWALAAEGRGTTGERVAGPGGLTLEVTRPAGGAGPGPVVVIAHGFAGSARIMEGFALTAARAGFTAVRYDLAGHGRNPAPLMGSVTEVEGATATLVAELRGVIAAARALGDGRVALVAHSMASDIAIRAAAAEPGVAAVIAVSMFSPEVTEVAPANLLALTGAWEGRLIEEGARVLALAGGRGTEGEVQIAPGNLRAARVIAGADHVGILWNAAAQEAVADWLVRTLGAGQAEGAAARRGPAVLGLLAAGVALAGLGLAALPRSAPGRVPAPVPGRRFWPVVVAPAVLTPLLLWPLPTGFLPVLVADYLALHLALWGALTALMLGVGRHPVAPRPGLREGGAALAAVAVAAVTLGLPVHLGVTNLWPGEGRGAVLALMLAGGLAGFVALEWGGRGPGPGSRPRGAFLALKAGLVLSLALAVALDVERLFFLLIILPVVVLFFVVFGVLSGVAWRRTGHPLPGGVMNGVAFGWALAATFPLLAG